MKTSLKKAALRSATCVAAFTFTATGAYAQDAATEEAPASEAIVVTGSRINNPNLTQAAPVNVTTADTIQLAQNNVAEEVLREIPGIVPSIGSAVNNGNGGASYVDLRGLGSNRNIVLLDGQRIVPAELVGRVDLNNIPLALVERVDVLTGGASATYGADAISGVVNFVINNEFEGLELNSSYQITEQGDGATFRTDLSTGASFDDGRGHVILGIGYQQADPVYQGQRGYSVYNVDSFSGEASGSGTTLPTRFGAQQIAPDGQSLVPYYQPYNFNPSNIFSTPFERFNIFSSAKYEVADNIEIYSRGMFSKQTVSTVIAPSGAFGISVDIPISNPFLNDGLRSSFCSIAGLDAASCALAAAATDPNDPNYRTATTSMYRRAVEVGPRISDYQTTMFDYRAGIRGDVTSNIQFDVSGAYGESENIQTIKGYTLNSRIRDSLLATNSSTCLEGTTDGCIPVNWFTPDATTLTAEQIDFLTEESTVINRFSLAQATAELSGNIGVSSPFASDPISFAAGVEFREYNASQASDTLAQTGDLGGAGGAAPNIKGGYKVYEVFGELQVPLVQDKPFFEELSLNAGVRQSHYEVDAASSPKYNTTTWTVGGVWGPVSDIKLRGNYSRAVRAPNIYELFYPVTTALTNLSDDPCATFTDTGGAIPGRSAPTGVLRDVCIAQGATAANVGNIFQPAAGQANYTGGGNINLKPEKSDSWTLGVVFQPSVVPGLSLTVDYYNIKIKDAITTPTPGDAMSACFDNLSVTNPACLAIQRNPLDGGLSGDPATTPGLALNLSNQGKLSTAGIDFTANYRRNIGFADLILALNGNWTDKSVFQSSPTGTARDCVGLYSENCASLQPKWQWSTRTTLAFENIDVSLLWRHIDSFKYEDFGEAFQGTLGDDVGALAGKNVNFNRIKAFDYFDLTTRFNATDNVTFTVTIQNLFDKKPPIVGSNIGSTAYNSGNTYPSTYDALGRRFAVAAKLRF
ncbi:MAG: TonB-dependent receptor [Novosphingobium sp.]|uniref:TonB-dependent receptor n=1 Tax=Novosphingobium sp. TaxID=1874826 RepID=UPI0012CB63AA|nr:TonB-dependent receptor [Novosphingobium sp.]MPS69172.1 TonB-dependent receptor [Novosphingobium sp.]